jgi:hypothetical protein
MELGERTGEIGRRSVSKQAFDSNAYLQIDIFKTVFLLAAGTLVAWASSTQSVRPASKNFLFYFLGAS